MSKLGPYELNTIVTGDARELAKAIPDESVDLIFTDPVYDRLDDYEWLAETAARVLKPDRPCLVWLATYALREVLNIMSQHLDYKWQFIEYRANEVKHRPAPGGKCVYAACLWFNKGIFRPSFVLDARQVAVYSIGSNYKWSKPPETTLYYLEKFTKENDIILDPFTGGGVVPAACRMKQRDFLAFEIKSSVAEIARQRIEQTPGIPMLFTDEFIQAELISL